MPYKTLFVKAANTSEFCGCIWYVDLHEKNSTNASHYRAYWANNNCSSPISPAFVRWIYARQLRLYVAAVVLHQVHDLGRLVWLLQIDCHPPVGHWVEISFYKCAARLLPAPCNTMEHAILCKVRSLLEGSLHDWHRALPHILEQQEVQVVRVVIACKVNVDLLAILCTRETCVLRSAA
jgi:hypothetical protein